MAAARADLFSPYRRRLLQEGACAAFAGSAASWPARSVAAGGPGLADFQKADIDWQAYKGRTLILGAIENPWTEGITPLLPLFQQLTGITVRVLKQSEADYVTAMPGRMSIKASTPDVLMVYSLGQFIANGWLTQLEPYYADGRLFDERWFNPADVFPAARLIPMWSDNLRYSQSISMEAQILFVNAAMLRRTGLAVPQNFDDLYRAAVRMKTPEHAGISLRCKAEGGTMWVLAGFVFSNGGALMESGTCVFDSDAAAGAVDYFVRLLRDAGPVPVNHDWYEAMRDFSQGASAMCVDSSSFATDLANPQKTPVTADVAYAPMPGNGRGPAQANVWAWQAGINAYSAHKEAAFLLLCFLNSPPGCLLGSANGLATPRPSAWESPIFRQRFGQHAVDAAIASAKSGATTKFKAVWQHPRSTLILDSLAKAVFQCVNYGGDVRAALKTQAAAVNRLLGKS